MTVGTSSRDAISIRGHDLVNELMGRHDFVSVAWLQMTGSLPTPQQSAMVNAILVTIADHGLTPSVLAARLTYYGAPESPQNAIAAGLLGAGSVVLGAMQNTAELVQAIVARGECATKEGRARAVSDVLERMAGTRSRVPGLGHPIHLDGDPRTPKLFSIARENGFYGDGCRVAEDLAEMASARTGRRLPLNAAGAIGAIVVDMGMSPVVARGLALIARTAGLLAHILDEANAPTARDIWAKADASVVGTKSS
jgi:citrate synthase